MALMSGDRVPRRCRGVCAASTGTRGDDVAGRGQAEDARVAGAFVAANLGDVADRAPSAHTIDTALQVDRTGANADIGPPQRST